MTLKIATWNVNSLRVRLPHVLAWLKETKPDVLALQEIKVINEEFPYDAFQQEGYHVIVSGQKSYNGVAIISRKEPRDVVMQISNFEDVQRRVLAATYDDIRVINLYVPNGEDVTSEKYLYKLNWLKHLDLHLHDELKQYSKTVVLGDFNIAPDDIDVHDPKRWTGKVLCTESERAAFQQMLARGFKDCLRLISPAEKLFSWWDYRLNAHQRNWGVRIDHILASEAFAPFCHNCYIDPIPRGWDRPSDHTPVIAEFKMETSPIDPCFYSQK